MLSRTPCGMTKIRRSGVQHARQYSVALAQKCGLLAYLLYNLNLLTYELRIALKSFVEAALARGF